MLAHARIFRRSQQIQAYIDDNLASSSDSTVDALLTSNEALKYEFNPGLATSLEHDDVTTDSVVIPSLDLTADLRKSIEQREIVYQNNEIKKKEPALKATVSGFQILVAARYGTKINE